jgi:hypothetical protein
VCKNACFSQVSPTEYAIFKNFGQSDGLKHFFLNFHFSNYKDVWICFQVFDGYFNNLLKVIAYLYLFVCGLKIMDLIMENSDYFIFCLVAFFLQKCLTCTHVHSLLHKAFDNVFIIIILVVLRFEVRALTLLGRYSKLLEPFIQYIFALVIFQKGSCAFCPGPPLNEYLTNIM